MNNLCFFSYLQKQRNMRVSGTNENELLIFIFKIHFYIASL